MSLIFKVNPFRAGLFCASNICGLLLLQGLWPKADRTLIPITSARELVDASRLMRSYVKTTGHFPAVGVPIEGSKLTYEDPVTRTRLPIGFNNKLRGLRLSEIKEPSNTVVFYIPSFKSSSPGLTVSFADFSVGTVRYEDLGDLVWDPSAR